ncbi:MAG: 3-hydroxybutyryl-CoA dehydrogenase [Ignavibacterium sp.]|jgi:3-hydroxybutyryl-CoA dehydrogenase|nr:3-hydroxybutyryl-CoA dehydrogenase [Ignavibacterium sp.]MDX9712925.1 3-hydroxybutyryl-CoA dehydrogenase [Ignavibacteriaceae bacterium]MEB2354625.1 3-hydroxybutyryl-CoA dehydrogenase [Ignavibacteriales bacterium]
MNIKKVAVIGGGTMGNGIAHVFALNNFDVYLTETSEALLDRAINTITSNLDRQVKKQIITDDQKNKVLERIIRTTGIEKIPTDVQLIIEAIFENKEVKLTLFKELQDRINPECIFASNTSSISITELSAVCRPDKFIGMHFMNPVPVMKLVEVIRAYSTSDETFNTIKELSYKLDKEPVEVFDYPGFISNRILMPMINEAIFALMEGVASKEAIDSVMKLGMAHPMGPLTLADFIGLDVCLAIMNVIFEGYNDSKYRPCPLLKKMVAANKLGRKTGEGFYKYN